MGRIKAVIVDIDGTLLLSNDAHAQSFVDAAGALGISANFVQIRRLVGKGSDKLIPEVFGFEKESERGKKLDELKGEIFKKEYLPSLMPAPGARSLLARFRDDGRRVVVATSSGKEDVKHLLDQAGVRDLIEDAASSGDADKSKPDPDIVVAALERTGEDKDDVVMLGDTPYDVEAALRAGIRIVAVRCGGWSDPDLEGATAIYEDPAEIVASYHHSIFK